MERRELRKSEGLLGETSSQRWIPHTLATFDGGKIEFQWWNLIDQTSSSSSMEVGEEGFWERILLGEMIMREIMRNNEIGGLNNLGNKLETIPKNNKIFQNLQKCHPMHN